jgi:hypothetical protein
VELHPVDRLLPVAQAHDDTACGSRGHVQFVWDGPVNDGQAVVPRRPEFIRDAGEQLVSLMLDLRGLAVHQLIRVFDFAPERFRDGLVAKAHSKKRL